jgi:hypothetical protein
VKAEFVLSLPNNFAQKHAMENQPCPTGIKGVVQWAITPPQSYAVYLLALFLVAGLSFYAGTLKPKKATGIGPPPISAPRN